MYNIPNHKRCINCGDCCGPVPIDKEEMRLMKEKIDTLEPSYIRFVLGQKRDVLSCPFRDIANKCCIIYSARPILCRLMGVTAGMKCFNGNTCELDLYHVVSGDKSIKNTFEVIEYLRRVGE